MSALSVLVADDEAGIALLLQKWLQEAGHTVMSVDNGVDAARLLKTHRFDLVITDVMMPDSDGLEVIAACKKLQPAPRILAISGGGKYLPGNDCLKIAQGLGADAVVLKPFSAEQVFDAIRLLGLGALPAADFAGPAPQAS